MSSLENGPKALALLTGSRRRLRVTDVAEAALRNLVSRHPVTGHIARLLDDARPIELLPARPSWPALEQARPAGATARPAPRRA